MMRVCGDNNKNYFNDCLAECDGARVECRGQVVILYPVYTDNTISACPVSLLPEADRPQGAHPDRRPHGARPGHAGRLAEADRLHQKPEKIELLKNNSYCHGLPK